MTSSLKVLWNRSFAQDGRQRKVAPTSAVRPAADLKRGRRLV
jgi:hypothetical protein